MADIVEVNFNALQHSAASLSTKAKALVDHLEQLSSNLQPLKATWYASGSAAGGAADSSETRLRQATMDIINIINQFSGKVTDAHELQHGLETRNTNLFA